jgi:hypothetical protein
MTMIYPESHYLAHAIPQTLTCGERVCGAKDGGLDRWGFLIGKDFEISFLIFSFPTPRFRAYSVVLF